MISDVELSLSALTAACVYWCQQLISLGQLKLPGKTVSENDFAGMGAGALLQILICMSAH